MDQTAGQKAWRNKIPWYARGKTGLKILKRAFAVFSVAV